MRLGPATIKTSFVELKATGCAALCGSTPQKQENARLLHPPARGAREAVLRTCDAKIIGVRSQRGRERAIVSTQERAEPTDLRQGGGHDGCHG
jgi:hypothetical protein